VVPNDFSNQVHDFDPGIAPSGLFWTIRIPNGRVHVDLDKATASMVIGNADILDYFNIPNALFGPQPPLPANVSFELRWSGVLKRVHTRDETNHFVGDYIEDTATLRWSAKEEGFHFVSDPAKTSNSVFAEIGSERNGVFFS
jgi:hypothetical protein